MLIRLQTLIGDRRGATAIEYSLIVALIALASVGAIGQVAIGSGSIWARIASAVG